MVTVREETGAERWFREGIEDAKEVIDRGDSNALLLVISAVPTAAPSIPRETLFRAVGTYLTGANLERARDAVWRGTGQVFTKWGTQGEFLSIEHSPSLNVIDAIRLVIPAFTHAAAARDHASWSFRFLAEGSKGKRTIADPHWRETIDRPLLRDGQVVAEVDPNEQSYSEFAESVAWSLGAPMPRFRPEEQSQAWGEQYRESEFFWSVVSR